jgi:hypothetical protein
MDDRIEDMVNRPLVLRARVSKPISEVKRRKDEKTKGREAKSVR